MLYEFVIDNDGNADADVKYQFRFHTDVKNPNTFLYNFGQITSLTSAVWNRVQTYSVTRVTHGHTEVLGSDLLCPPVNIGPRSTPNYAALATAAVHTLTDGSKVFAGQRKDGFFVDLGSIFDLGDAAPVREPPPHPDRRRGRPQLPGIGERPHDRDPGAQDEADQGWPQPDRRRPTAASTVGIYARASRRTARILQRLPRTSSPVRGSRSRAWATR